MVTDQRKSVLNVLIKNQSMKIKYKTWTKVSNFCVSMSLADTTDNKITFTITVMKQNGIKHKSSSRSTQSIFSLRLERLGAANCTVGLVFKCLYRSKQKIQCEGPSIHPFAHAYTHSLSLTFISLISLAPFCKAPC